MSECKNCIYYYPDNGKKKRGYLCWCMNGEEGVPTDGIKECEKKKGEGK